MEHQYMKQTVKEQKSLGNSFQLVNLKHPKAVDINALSVFHSTSLLKNLFLYAVL